MSRISFEVLRAKVAEITALMPTLHVGTRFDLNAPEKYGKTFPAVWIVAQRSRRISPVKGGYSGNHREEHEVEFLLEYHTERFASGATNNQADCDALCDAVFNKLSGWTVPGTTVPLSQNVERDSAEISTYCCVEASFVTTRTNQ
jgi:hypothetical protein